MNSGISAEGSPHADVKNTLCGIECVGGVHRFVLIWTHHRIRIWELRVDF
jgi:hypothetical protein